jgi:hypothetical protein
MNMSYAGSAGYLGILQQEVDSFRNPGRKTKDTLNATLTMEINKNATLIYNTIAPSATQTTTAVSYRPQRYSRALDNIKYVTYQQTIHFLKNLLEGNDVAYVSIYEDGLLNQICNIIRIELENVENAISAYSILEDVIKRSGLENYISIGAKSNLASKKSIRNRKPKVLRATENADNLASVPLAASQKNALDFAKTIDESFLKCTKAIIQSNDPRSRFGPKTQYQQHPQHNQHPQHQQRPLPGDSAINLDTGIPGSTFKAPFSRNQHDAPRQGYSSDPRGIPDKANGISHCSLTSWSSHSILFSR